MKKILITIDAEAATDTLVQSMDHVEEQIDSNKNLLKN
jgi:hypothetical protein